MPFHLTHNSYGKSLVRLTKVVRTAERHELFEIAADISLEGDFAPAYLAGDNRNVIATDTIKNTVYVLAREHPFDTIETFALLLARHFLSTYPHVSRATVALEQTPWQRIAVDAGPHPHAFVSAGSHRHTATAIATRTESQLTTDLTTELTGGITGLAVIKTTASAWENFHADKYRTLKDAPDRILGTTIDAAWTYASPSLDFARARDAALQAMLTVFATEFSPSAQFTLRQMGEAALAAVPELSEITITLPNQHRIPFNLSPFGHSFDNDIFITTNEPYGLIQGTLKRA